MNMYLVHEETDLRTCAAQSHFSPPVNLWLIESQLYFNFNQVKSRIILGIIGRESEFTLRFK
jgi:hypothetical protein